MRVGVRKKKDSFSGYVQLSCCFEACLNQIRLDDYDGCRAASQVVSKFECSVAWITAGIHATETKNPVRQNRIVDGVESQNADTITVLQTEPTEACCKLSDRFPTLPCAPVSLSVERVDVQWLILIKLWRVEVPR